MKGDEIVVVGDTHRDVECAQAIGAHSLAVGTGGGSLEELHKAGATWVVRDLREFPIRQLQDLPG